MDKIIDIVYSCLYVVGLIALIITGLIKMIKSKSTNKNLAYENETLQSTLDIMDVIREAMIKAESFSNYTGAEKSAYVESAVRSLCYDKEIDIADVDVQSIISYFMEVGDKINARKKTNEQEQENGTTTATTV